MPHIVDLTFSSDEVPRAYVGQSRSSNKEKGDADGSKTAATAESSRPASSPNISPKESSSAPETKRSSSRLRKPSRPPPPLKKFSGSPDDSLSSHLIRPPTSRSNPSIPPPEAPKRRKTAASKTALLQKVPTPAPPTRRRSESALSSKKQQQQDVESSSKAPSSLRRAGSSGSRPSSELKDPPSNSSNNKRSRTEVSASRDRSVKRSRPSSNSNNNDNRSQPPPTKSHEKVSSGRVTRRKSKIPSRTDPSLSSGAAIQPKPPKSTQTSYATDYKPRDPILDRPDPILNHQELELVWLSAESMYCHRSSEINWSFLYEHASELLRVELRQMEQNHSRRRDNLSTAIVQGSLAQRQDSINCDLQNLIRWNDRRVRERFKFVQLFLLQRYIQGYRRPAVARTVAKMILKGPSDSVGRLRQNFTDMDGLPYEINAQIAEIEAKAKGKGSKR